jgi:hypothetical protein
MDKLDRLVWADGVSFTAYGLKIGVRVTKAEAMDRVRLALPVGWQPSESPFVDSLYSFVVGGAGARHNVRLYNILHFGLTKLARTMDLDATLETLEGHMQIHVGEFARERIFVHAGVVGWKGKAILLPGRSFAGKSTLVAALLKQGATYYSDEYAVLDSQGLVHAYPRRLALRRPDAAVPLRMRPEDLGSRTGAGPLPVGVVAVTRYRAGARWKPQRISSGKAVLELLDATLPAMNRPKESMEALNRAVPQALCLRGLRGEADETAAALLASCA